MDLALAPANLSELDLNSNGDRSKPLSSAPKSDFLLSPAMSLDAAARTVLAFHFDRMVANEAGALREDDPEPLHDMRVATRNLRAALCDFRKAFPKRTMESLDGELEWLAQLLGRIRDLDVFVLWLEAHARRTRGKEKALVQRVIQDREQARTRERAALAAALNSERYQKLKRAFGRFVVTKSSKATQTKEPLVSMASSKIVKELKRVRKRGKGANLDHLRRLHRLRIECKRLRYTSEFFKTLFPDLANKVIGKASDIQDLLGVVHDTDVHSQFLEKMRCAEPDQSPLAESLSRMIDALHQEQLAKYKEFLRIYRRVGSKKFQRKVMKTLVVS